MTDKLDTSKLVPLDVTGLEPIDEQSKPLNVSGLEPLDVSGLEPVDAPPVQPVAAVEPTPVATAFTPAAGSSSQAYTPVIPKVEEPVGKTIWNRNDGVFQNTIKPGVPIGIVYQGKKMMAVYDAITGKFKTEIDDKSKVIKGNGLPAWTDAFNMTADTSQDTYGKVELDPSQIEAFAEGKGALRSIRNTALRALPSTASSFAAFNAGGIPAAAWAARIHPYAAPVGFVVGGGLSAMGAGAITDMGINAMFPLDENDELNQLLYPTQNAITQQGVAIAALRPSARTLAGIVQLQKPALIQAGKGAALNTALAGQHRLVEEITSDKPFSVGHVFSPSEMAKDAAQGAFLMHKATAMGKAFEYPGKVLGAKLSPTPKPTASTEELRAANQPLDTSGLEPVAAENKPAQQGNVPPRITIEEARTKYPNGYDGEVVWPDGRVTGWSGTVEATVNIGGDKPNTPASPQDQPKPVVQDNSQAAFDARAAAWAESNRQKDAATRASLVEAVDSANAEFRAAVEELNRRDGTDPAADQAAIERFRKAQASVDAAVQELGDFDSRRPAPQPAPSTAPSAQNVPPRPGRINGDSSARDAWDEQYGDMRRGGRTHNNDGTPMPVGETSAEASQKAFNSTITSNDQSRALGFETTMAAADFAEKASHMGWVFDKQTNTWSHPERPGQGFKEALAEWKKGVHPRPKRENYSSVDDFNRDASIWDRDLGKKLDPITGLPLNAGGTSEAKPDQPSLPEGIDILSSKEQSARTAEHNRKLKEVESRPIAETAEEAVRQAEEDYDAWVGGNAFKLREQAKKENTPDPKKALELINQAELIEAKKKRLRDLQKAADENPEKYGPIADAAFDHITKLQQQAREQANKPPVTNETPKSVQMLEAEAARGGKPAEPAKTEPAEPVIPEAQESSPEVQLAHLREQRDRLAATQPEPGTTQEAQLKKLNEAVANLEKKVKEDRDFDPAGEQADPRENPKDVAEREAAWREESPADTTEPSKEQVDYETQKNIVSGLERQLAAVEKRKPDRYTETQKKKIQATLDRERAKLDAMPVPAEGEKPKKERVPRKVIYDDASLRRINGRWFTIDVKNGGSKNLSLNQIKESMPHLYDKAVKMNAEAEAKGAAEFKRIDADIRRFAAEAKKIADSDMTTEQKRDALEELDKRVTEADFNSPSEQHAVFVGIDNELLTKVENSPRPVDIREAPERDFPVDDPANGWQEGTGEYSKLRLNVEVGPNGNSALMGIAIHLREAKDAFNEGMAADALEMAQQAKGLAETLEGYARRRAKKLVDSFEQETGIKIGKSIEAEETHFKTGEPIKGVPFPDSGPATEGLVNKKGSKKNFKNEPAEDIRERINDLQERADELDENDPDGAEELRIKASKLQDKLDAMDAAEQPQEQQATKPDKSGKETPVNEGNGFETEIGGIKFRSRNVKILDSEEEATRYTFVKKTSPGKGALIGIDIGTSHLTGKMSVEMISDTGKRNPDGTVLKSIETADIVIPEGIKTVDQLLNLLKKGTLTEFGPNWNNPKKPGKAAKAIKKLLDSVTGEGEAGQGAKPKPKVTPPDAGQGKPVGADNWTPDSPSLDPKTAPFDYEKVIKHFKALMDIADYNPLGKSKKQAQGRVENMIKQLEKIFPGIKDAVLEEGFSPNDATREEAMEDPGSMAKLLGRYLSRKFRPYRDFDYEQKNPVKKPVSKDQQAVTPAETPTEAPSVSPSGPGWRKRIRTDYTEAERKSYFDQAVNGHEKNIARLKKLSSGKNEPGVMSPKEAKKQLAEEIESLERLKKGLELIKKDPELQELINAMAEMEKQIVTSDTTYSRIKKKDGPDVARLEPEIYDRTKRLLEKGYTSDEIYGALHTDPNPLLESQNPMVQAMNEQDGYKLGGVSVTKEAYAKWKAQYGSEATKPKKTEPVQEAAQEPAEKKYPIEKLEDALAEKGLKVLRRNNTDDFVAEGGVEDNGRQRPTLVVGDTKITLASEGMELVNGKVQIMDAQEKDAAGEVIYSIERIVTAPEGRGKGSASKALAELTEAADKAGLTLQLEPTPFRSIIGKGESLNKQQLIEWYKKNGFEQKTEGSDAILIRNPGAAKDGAAPASREVELFASRGKVIESLKNELSETTDKNEAKRLKNEIAVYEHQQEQARRIIEVENKIAELEASGKGNGPTAKKLRDVLEIKKAAWGEREIDAKDIGRASSSEGKEGTTLDMRRDPEEDQSGWAKERMDKLFKEWRERHPDASELDFWKEARKRTESQTGGGWFDDIAWRQGVEVNNWPKHKALRDLINQKLDENTRDIGLQKTWTHEDGTKIITDGNRFFAYDKDGNSIGPRDGETSFKSIVHRVVQHGDDIQFREGSGYRAKQKQNEYDRRIDKVRDEITEARRDGNEVLTQLKLKELESLLTESKRWSEGALEQKEARDEARSNRKSSYENEKKWTLDETLDSRRDPGEARDNAPKKPFSYPNTKKFNEWARGNQYGFKPAQKMPLLVRGIDAIRDFAKLVDGFVTTAFHGTKSEGRDFDQFKPGELTYFVADRDAAGAYAKDSPDMYYVRSKRPAVLTNPREAIKAFENGDKSDIANIGKDLIEFYEKVASKQFGDRESFISALEEGRLFDIDGKGQKGLQNEMAEWFLKKKEGLKYDSVVFKDSTVSSESPSIVVSNDGDPRLGGQQNTGVKAASNFGEFSSEDPRFDYSRRDPNNDANDAFDMEERKAKELDRRVKQNAENREAGKEEDGGRRGFIGIMDRAVSEARMRGEITDKEVEGLSRIINYVGGQFFGGVKMSIRQGKPGNQGQYDVANRIVTIFKEAIQNGRFEDTAAHEVGHHLEQFLPEGDRAALRAEWQAARKEFTNKWGKFASLVGDAENWGRVKVSPEAYDAAIADFPTLSRFFTPEYTDKGKIKHYRVRATEEMYRLFSPREWFAETFKDAAREKLNNDPAYTGEQPGWKQKAIGLWNNIKTAFNQMFGREQAKRILANFAKGRYKPEDADPSIYSEGDQMFSKREKSEAEQEARLTPEERDAIDDERRISRDEARGEKPELSAGGKVWRSVVDSPFVSWFKPISMRMRTIGDLNPQSEALQKLVNDFSLIPGREATGPDFNTDVANMRNVFYNKLTRAFGTVLEDMHKMPAAERAEFDSLFIRAMEGRLPRKLTGEVGAAVERVRAVMEEMHKYATDRGLKMGKVEGYFPRSVDANLVAADEKGFIRAATRAYEKQFERLQAEAEKEAIENGTEYVRPETPDFDMMARNWRTAIMLGHEGLDFEHGLFDSRREASRESFQKGREFSKEEALEFDEFRDKDVERIVSNYVGAVVRRSELVRRIGDSNNSWKGIKMQMDKQGVSVKDINAMEELIKSNIGINGKRIGESTQQALDFTKLVSNAAYLKLTGLLNYAEAASIGIRAESPIAGAKAVFDMFARSGNMLTRLTPEQTKNAKNEIEAIYGQGHDLASALAIEFGINTIDRGFGTVASGYHLDGGSDFQGKLNKASDGVYRMYGIHASEAAKREVSIRAGADFIDTTIKWLEGTHNLQRLGKAMGKEVRADNLAKERLKELGLTEAEIPKFVEWVKKMRSGNESSQLRDIMSNDPMAQKYSRALILFNKQASVQASRASRSEAANDTAIGKLFFQFTTFTNEWSAQHGRRMVEQSKKVFGDKKYNATEKMLMAGVAPAFALATAATWGIRTIINKITGFQYEDGDRVPSWVKSLADAFVYTGVMGPAESVWKLISRGQLPAGVVGDWVKKAVQTAQALADNPESNAAQRNAVSMTYRSAAVPAVASGLAMAADAGPLPVKLGVGLAAQVVANNRTEKSIADLVAGEEVPRGSNQMPTPPKPPRPGAPGPR